MEKNSLVLLLLHGMWSYWIINESCLHARCISAITRPEWISDLFWSGEMHEIIHQKLWVKVGGGTFIKKELLFVSC